MTDMTDPDWWCPLAAGIDTLPPAEQHPQRLALAWRLAAARKPSEASDQALQAFRVASGLGDEAGAIAARTLLTRLLPGYHVQVPTDPVRAAAWDAALRAVIRPDMRALEIGAGSGILAMLAARAGAQVVSCEHNLALAAIAEEVVALNGFADRIRIVARPIRDLAIPEDLDAPADLLFYDTFADNLFDFEPFRLARQALPLLTPDAVVVPNAVTLCGALAQFVTPNQRSAGAVAGLDLSPMAVLDVVSVACDSASPGLRLRSPSQPMVEAQLPHAMPGDRGEVVRTFVSEGGTVSGVALWLRLELAPGIVLEARPGAHRPGFYARPKFHSFGREIETAPGDTFAVRLVWDGKHVVATLASVAPT